MTDGRSARAPRYTHLMARLFGTPLLIHQAKLEAILHALGPRLGLDTAAAPVAAAPVMPGTRQADDYPADPREIPGNVSVIQIYGPLVKRASGDFLSGGPTTYQEIEGQYFDAMNDPRVEGILLDIDSPGGEVGGCFDLAETIYSRRGTKPCYAIANDDCFSAAYALGSSAERLYCTTVGGVGSIGAICTFVDQSKLDEKLGVSFKYIASGKKKAQFNPHSPLSDDAESELQSEIDRLGTMFCAMVARNRKMDVADVQGMEAGLSFGPAGVGSRLADEMGTYSDAMNGLLARIQTSRGSSSRKAASAAILNKEAVMPDSVPEAEVSTKPAEAKTVAPSMPAPEADANTKPADFKAELEAAVAKAHGEGYEVARSIANLCLVGKHPELAPQFITDRKTVDQVRDHLLGMKADATDKDTVDSHHGSPSASLETLQQQATGIAKQRGISVAAATTELLAANPKLYDQYLAERKTAARIA